MYFFFAGEYAIGERSAKVSSPAAGRKLAMGFTQVFVSLLMSLSGLSLLEG